MYLLAIGFGAPVPIQSIELGPFRASLTGIGVGAVVSMLGLVLIWIMTRWRKTVKVEKTVFSGGDGFTTSRTETFSSTFRAGPD